MNSRKARNKKTEKSKPGKRSRLEFRYLCPRDLRPGRAGPPTDSQSEDLRARPSGHRVQALQLLGEHGRQSLPKPGHLLRGALRLPRLDGGHMGVRHGDLHHVLVRHAPPLGD